MSTTTTSTSGKKSAVKGAVAAAAGVAVLLGGAGTFALWNQSGSIGTVGTQTGALSATFSDQTTWKDVTDGADNDIADIAAFRMVPGDTVVGTTTVDVTATGENLLVDAGLDAGAANLPEGVTATVLLSDGTDSGAALELEGSNEGTLHRLTADVTLTFDPDTEGSENTAIDLTNVKVDLQQRLHGAAGV
ncbi:alternate-type signal peptide domain-containing protein [Isoptericola sp. NEAU-Y5]|uniref:Alternate-type signal peptide domain-containing protein n=1 Tax=Isoptericola luteus TaxID=2879484 RepID=A0ABS7ZCV6_9MICO|nr:alternate-type signal peptide domain-containing protein [Isoptericola sp. NEAU-Y5]MCA5892131.1 alternate-type signal peptide domain-containing protein [Isoptericola sp. NEAU-Y5]